MRDVIVRGVDGRIKMNGPYPEITNISFLAKLFFKIFISLKHLSDYRTVGLLDCRIIATASYKLAFNVCTVQSPTIKDSILFSRNFPVDVIGDIKVFLASFNFKYFLPLYKPCLLILAVKMIHRDGKLKPEAPRSL